MMESKDNLTPAMKQFHHFKAKHPDCILFFRMGDFYETFFDDAKTCSKVLGLTLTSRGKNGPDPVPLAGVPYHAVDGYLKKMLQAGFRVAVCEQVEDPKTAKGVVKRDVVRIVTPGTLTDDMLLEDKKDNFLCAIHLDARGHAVISWVDISTGHFFVQRVGERDLLDELQRLSPAECLLADRRGELFDAETRRLAADVGRLTHAIVTERPGWYFDPYQARQRLLKHFGAATLEGFGISDREQDLIPPAGAVIEYLNETQKTTLGHIQNLRKISRRNFLQIDPTSLRSLEILQTIRSETRKGSLLTCLDETLTGMGGRMFRNWLCMPLCDVDAIEARQDAVEELMGAADELADLRRRLANIADTERIAARISTFRAGPRDMLALASTLGQIPALRELLTGFRAQHLRSLAERCDSMDELAHLLETAIDPDCPIHMRDGGFIRSGFSAELDRLRSISKDGQSWLRDYQKQQAERTGIANLKVGYNKVFGYYLEVPRSFQGDVPEEWIRKQTLTNAERYITGELKELESKVLGAQERITKLEYELFCGVRETVARSLVRIQQTSHAVATLDVLCSFAKVAVDNGYVCPEITEDGSVIIKDGRHPVVEKMLDGAPFVPNDTALDLDDAQAAIITGPNMAGKSTYMRQVALIVLMAQMGSFVPASSARISICDAIFTRVGASDDLASGQSTFMVEMNEVATILKNATRQSLIILDEIGRGTSTFDGMAIAKAVLEYVCNKRKIGAKTLFATHYHELTDMEEELPGIKNYNIACKKRGDDIIFLRRIVPGPADGSYGIEVAKLAGVPNPVVKRAREVLKEIIDEQERTGGVLKVPTEVPEESGTSPEDFQISFTSHASDEILDELKALDVNTFTPIEAMNYLYDLSRRAKES